MDAEFVLCACVCTHVFQSRPNTGGQCECVCVSVWVGLPDRCQVSQVLEEVRSLVDSLISCLSGGTNHYVSSATWHFARCVWVCVCLSGTEFLCVCVFLPVSLCMLGLWKRFWSWQDCRLHTVCAGRCAFCVCVCQTDANPLSLLSVFFSKRMKWQFKTYNKSCLMEDNHLCVCLCVCVSVHKSKVHLF